MKFLSSERVLCVAVIVAIVAGWKGNLDALERSGKRGSWHCLLLLSDLRYKGSCGTG